MKKKKIPYKNKYSGSNKNNVFFSTLADPTYQAEQKEYHEYSVYKVSPKTYEESLESWVGKPVRYNHKRASEENSGKIIGEIVDAFMNDDGYYDQKGNLKDYTRYPTICYKINDDDMHFLKKEKLNGISTEFEITDQHKADRDAGFNNVLMVTGIKPLGIAICTGKHIPKYEVCNSKYNDDNEDKQKLSSMRIPMIFTNDNEDNDINIKKNLTNNNSQIKDNQNNMENEEKKEEITPQEEVKQEEIQPQEVKPEVKDISNETSKPEISKEQSKVEEVKQEQPEQKEEIKTEKSIENNNEDNVSTKLKEMNDKYVQLESQNSQILQILQQLLQNQSKNNITNNTQADITNDTKSEQTQQQIQKEEIKPEIKTTAENQNNNTKNEKKISLKDIESPFPIPL